MTRPPAGPSPVKSLRDWVARQSSYRDASHLQEPVDALRDLQRQQGGGPVYGDAVPFEHGIGRVVGKGPANEADGTNAVYWIQGMVMGPAGWTVPPALLPDSSNQIDDDSPPNVFPAIHLSERYAGSHQLATDGTVEVFYWSEYDTDDPPNKHYLFLADRGLELRFGKLKTAWPEFADHNKVTLTPCRSASDATVLTDSAGTPLPDVTAYIQTPLGSAPPFFAVNVGDVVAYFPDPDGNNVLIHCPLPGTNALYDVLQITSIVGGKGVGSCGPLRAQ